jgi:PAS domain S-box-containing protein
VLRMAERERSQAAQKESDALYEASFNAAAVGIAHTAADGRWLRVNPRFCQILGYSREEALQLRIQDITHPDDLADEAAGFRQLMAGQITSYHREKRYLHKTGDIVWVDLTVSLLHDAKGNPKHFIAVLEDVTQRKRAEDRQHLLAGASQVLLRSLDHQATIDDVARLAITSLCDWCIVATTHPDEDPVCHVAVAHRDPSLAARASDLQHRLAGNPSFQQFLTRDQTEISSDLSQLAADAWNLDTESWKSLRKLGCASTMSVPLAIRQQSVGQLILVSGEPTKRFGAGDLATAQELAQRIALGTENARLYHEAQQAIRARDEFLSIASHELRTPLTPLQIHFQRLLRQPGDEILAAPARLQHTLERCERQVRRLEALIDNLLDVSRISSGRLRLQPETVDLADVVRDVSGRFTEELTAAGCELLLDSDQPVVGHWDRLRLEQVVTNVLGNAIKYGGGKPIEIRVEETPETGRLRIQDHGIGIEGDDLTRIFRRFQRAVSSRSYGGLGLGLYITRQIVDAHCGSIEVESTPGAGSVFTVELPRASPDAARVDGAAAQGVSASYEHRAHASS